MLIHEYNNYETFERCVRSKITKIIINLEEICVHMIKGCIEA